MPWPGDQSAPPLAKLQDEGLQQMAAAMLFHFPRSQKQETLCLERSRSHTPFQASPLNMVSMGCGRFIHCNEIVLPLNIPPFLYSTDPPLQPKHFTIFCPRFTCEPGEGHHGFGVPLVGSCYRHCRWFGRRLLWVDVGGSATGPRPDAWTSLWKIHRKLEAMRNQ